MNLGFIGTGRIASDIVHGLNLVPQPGERIYLSPRGRETGQALAATYPNVQVCLSNQEVVDVSDVVFLSVRPEILAGVLRELRFRPDQLLVSMVPFFSLAQLRDLAASQSVVRAVPIPSVRRCQSPTGIYPDEPRARRIFERLGAPVVVNQESDFLAILTITALIKPTYQLMERVALWGTDHGLAEDVATRFVLSQFHSLIGLAAEGDGESLASLALGAATPGGLNEQATRLIGDAGALETFTSALDRVLGRLETWTP